MTLHCWQRTLHCACVVCSCTLCTEFLILWISNDRRVAMLAKYCILIAWLSLWLGIDQELREKNRLQYQNIAVFPCKLRILPNCIFNTRDPIIVGVVVEAGVVKPGTPLTVPSKEVRCINLVQHAVTFLSTVYWYWGCCKFGSKPQISRCLPERCGSMPEDWTHWRWCPKTLWTTFWPHWSTGQQGVLVSSVYLFWSDLVLR